MGKSGLRSGSVRSGARFRPSDPLSLNAFNAFDCHRKLIQTACQTTITRKEIILYDFGVRKQQQCYKIGIN